MRKNKKNTYIHLRAGYIFCVLLVLFAAVVITAFCFLPAGSTGRGILTVLAILTALVLWFGYKWVFVPCHETTLLLGEFTTGSLSEDLGKIRFPYNCQMERATEKIFRYVEQASALESSKRQAQYQALQNQINPHFLYNTLESIRSEAVLSGLDSVDAMCEALANFFRYTISNMEDVVSLRDELANVRNYFTIQQYRFEDRLILTVTGDDQEEALECLLPKLTLQPIVENAIIHGLERRVGTGMVSVQLTLTKERLIILVSDDGLGMDEETLAGINHDIVANVSHGGSRGGIAIGNVNNRIRLLFGDSYGVTVYSAKGAGTDVEITLPRTTQVDRQRFQQGDLNSSYRYQEGDLNNSYRYQ